VLAIEVRKATNHQPLAHDRHKLMALTDPHLWFAYWIGVLVILDRRSVLTEVYVGARIDPPLSAWFAGRLQQLGLAAG
jgi:hypothetical protein